jgi:hypothetical protein
MAQLIAKSVIKFFSSGSYLQAAIIGASKRASAVINTLLMYQLNATEKCVVLAKLIM